MDAALARTLEFVHQFRALRGRSPGMREIGLHLGCAVSTAHKYTRRLVAEGYLRSNAQSGGEWRLEVVPVGTQNRMVRIGDVRDIVELLAPKQAEQIVSRLIGLSMPAKSGA